MCEPQMVPSVSPSDYEKMPSVIDNEDPLFNVGKKELEQALSQAYLHDWVADWLFTQPSQIFHPRTAAVPPEAFDNSLAIHLHHDISTPPPCTRPQQSSKPDPSFTVTKDIDLLLVPVLNVDGITAGYSFLKGVQQAHLNTFSKSPPPDPHRPGQFIAGRFSFDNAARDFLMVVNSMSPHMTGLVSMRWREQSARERSFFAIPKAEYGPRNLPQRVLSVQCNVDYEIPSEKPSQFQFAQHDAAPPPDSRLDPASPTNSYSSPPPSFASECDADCKTSTCGAEELKEDTFERDFINQGDIDPEEEAAVLATNLPAISSASEQENGDPDSWLQFDDALDSVSWGDGLQSIGTVISPDDDPNGVIPEVLQDFMQSGQYSDDIDRILSEATDINSRSNSSGSSDISSPRGSKRPKDADELVLSTVGTQTSSTDMELNVGSSFGSIDSSWMLSADGTTPDGIGIPRRPGRNETSSGAFDMRALLGSLATIERSLKGHFYGPKVRKDILHPQTGELISRCTGVVTARLDAVDPANLSLLRSIAAQSYYSSLLSVCNDSRLISAGPRQEIVTGGKKTRGGEEPKRKQGRREIVMRGPTALAPRPVATVVLPPGLPHPEVLQLGEVGVEKDSEEMDEEMAKEAKLEAKRIKNRLSAARSNQKRRAQLDAQKKELAALRARVEQLKSRKQHVTEENENLKQVISRS